MKELGRFDPDLGMFVEAPREPTLTHLKYLRYLAEKGKFGPVPLSPPRGDYMLRLTDVEIMNYVTADTRSKQQQLREHIAITGGK